LEPTEFTPPVRLHRYNAHLIIYRVGNEDILIIRVLHGRQNWEQLL
jgi:toxin ParE1/3/4